MWILEVAPKGYVLLRDWSTCSTLTILDLINNMIGATCIWPLNEHKNLHFGIDKIFLWTPKIMRQMATCTIWKCQSSCTSCVFHIIWEVDVERNVSIYGMSTLLLANGLRSPWKLGPIELRAFKFSTKGSFTLSFGGWCFKVCALKSSWSHVLVLGHHKHACLTVIHLLRSNHISGSGYG